MSQYIQQLCALEDPQATTPVPWSNGPTEGTVDRVKMLKRQMYGRAKLDILRRRVLYATCPHRQSPVHA
ncbi:hypothetical protein [Streptomyces sp. H27-C3]|uniref:hypothetical protein n=1 Tax=Streptomyces sp. H27-C3 TaxID=3046305 RepID=UPI0024B8AEB1|nr:hypothetical protein [Streptomyces sp. H27-C3]MDJ0466408.1 hypothetical protein [Streptomyces sp. H27-C3]